MTSCFALPHQLVGFLVPYFRTTSSELFKSLHWLPIRHRINFKLAVLTTYLSCLLSSRLKLWSHMQFFHARIAHVTIALFSVKATVRTLRSSDQQFLHQPRIRNVSGSRGFSSAAPRVWNALPLHTR